jgi:hypothetical protein
MIRSMGDKLAFARYARLAKADEETRIEATTDVVTTRREAGVRLNTTRRGAEVGQTNGAFYVYIYTPAASHSHLLNHRTKLAHIAPTVIAADAHERLLQQELSSVVSSAAMFRPP